MSAWKAKRFWKCAQVVPEKAGYAVYLDARQVMTPAKAPLIVPTVAMAKAIATEWDAQTEKIDPGRMPVTCSANAAIDKAMHQFDEVAALISAYGASDLLCYRAAHPQELVHRQKLVWDPMLDWADASFKVRLQVTVGISPIAQPPEHLARLAALVRGFSPFAMVALHDLVGLTGSLILGLAAAADGSDPDSIWEMSRIDEDWQAAQWGLDDGAVQVAQDKKEAFLHACRFLRLCADAG